MVGITTTRGTLLKVHSIRNIENPALDQSHSRNEDIELAYIELIRNKCCCYSGKHCELNNNTASLLTSTNHGL